MVLIGIVGNIRTGKTLFMTMLGYLLKQCGVTVYANYDTTFSKYVDAVNILEFELEDGTLLIDEVGTIADARNNSLANRLFSYFVNQSGKRGVNIIYTSQGRRLYDLRLDQITHILYKAQKTEDRFIFTKFINDDFGFVQKNRVEIPMKKAEPFYKMYDTKQIIFAPELSSSTMMDWNEVIDTFKKSKTQKAFSIAMRSMNPYIGIETYEAAYQYIKSGEIELAKKCLGNK